MCPQRHVAELVPQQRGTWMVVRDQRSDQVSPGGRWVALVERRARCRQGLRRRQSLGFEGSRLVNKFHEGLPAILATLGGGERDGGRASGERLMREH